MTRAPRSRRLILISAVAVLGLSACGSAASTSTGNTAGAGVTVPVGSGSTETTGSTVASGPAVISIGGFGQVGVAAAGDMAPMGADDVTTGKMMPTDITYVWDGSATDLPDHARAWYFPAGVAATEAQAAELASALGVEGEVRAVPEDQGGGWAVGSEDYSGPAVTIGTDAMLSWWYGGAIAVPSIACEGPLPIEMTDEGTSDASAMVAPPVDTSDTGVTTDISLPDCPEPAPPVDVPSAAEAEQLARDFFTGIGVDLSSYELETYADEWSAGVTAYLVVDGMKTYVSQYVGVGAHAAITYAGGFFASPVQGDEYPLIDPEAAAQRLTDQSMWLRGKDGPGGVYLDDTTVVESVGSGENLDSGESVAMPIAPPETLCDPACPAPEVEPIIVTLTEVEPSLEQQWANDGTIWLLPGYRFTADDGGIYSVIAVPDEYLEIAEAPVSEVPGDSIPVDTTPIGETPGTVVVPPEVSAPAGDVVCGGVFMIHTWDPGDLDVNDVSFLVGMCSDDAVAQAESLSFSVRVVREDGVDLPATADFSPTRANVAVVDSVVTEVLSIG